MFKKSTLLSLSLCVIFATKALYSSGLPGFGGSLEDERPLDASTSMSFPRASERLCAFVSPLEREFSCSLGDINPISHAAIKAEQKSLRERGLPVLGEEIIMLRERYLSDKARLAPGCHDDEDRVVLERLGRDIEAIIYLRNRLANLHGIPEVFAFNFATAYTNSSLTHALSQTLMFSLCYASRDLPAMDEQGMKSFLNTLSFVSDASLDDSVRMDFAAQYAKTPLMEETVSVLLKGEVSDETLQKTPLPLQLRATSLRGKGFDLNGILELLNYKKTDQDRALTLMTHLRHGYSMGKTLWEMEKRDDQRVSVDYMKFLLERRYAEAGLMTGEILASCGPIEEDILVSADKMYLRWYAQDKVRAIAKLRSTTLLGLILSHFANEA